MLTRLWTVLGLFLLIATPLQTTSATRYSLDFGGDFTLTDHDGNPFALSDARGKVVLISFGFMTCADVCPTTLFKIAKALRELGPAAEQVQPLFITVDTERDTQENLRKYVKSMHPSMIALTGTQDEVEAVATQYRTPVLVREPNEDGFYVVDHGSRLFLIDVDGVLANILMFESSSENLAEKIKELLPE